MKLNKDSKTAIILVGAFVLMLLLYGVDYIYKNHTGRIETEYILPYSEVQTVSVSGFAVRDENISVDGKNTSVFYKDDNLVYVPVISDSESIAKNGVIICYFLLCHFKPAHKNVLSSGFIFKAFGFAIVLFKARRALFLFFSLCKNILIGLTKPVSISS